MKLNELFNESEQVEQMDFYDAVHKMHNRTFTVGAKTYTVSHTTMNNKYGTNANFYIDGLVSGYPTNDVERAAFMAQLNNMMPKGVAAVWAETEGLQAKEYIPVELRRLPSPLPSKLAK